jgi:hypothetical protein
MVNDMPLWLSPRSLSAQALEFASFAAKTSICEAIPPSVIFRALSWLFKREGILMGIKLRTAFLRLPLRNEFTAQAAFFAFDLP